MPGFPHSWTRYGPVDARGRARTTPVAWFLPMNTRLALPNPIRYAALAFTSGALFRIRIAAIPSFRRFGS
jgi:hypothetical protein